MGRLDACLERAGLAGLPLGVIDRGDHGVRGGVAQWLNCAPHHDDMGKPGIDCRSDGMGKDAVPTQCAVEFVGAPDEPTAGASGK